MYYIVIDNTMVVHRFQIIEAYISFAVSNFVVNSLSHENSAFLYVWVSWDKGAW